MSRPLRGRRRASRRSRPASRLPAISANCPNESPTQNYSDLALTALGGGIALVAGFQTPPVMLLQGSPFRSYFLPGLALAFLVGGSAAFAVMALAFRHRSALLANLTAAVAVIVFEAVEIATIGSPEGPARNMQILYLSLGITIAAIVIFARTRASSPGPD